MTAKEIATASFHELLAEAARLGADPNKVARYTRQDLVAVLKSLKGTKARNVKGR